VNLLMCYKITYESKFVDADNFYADFAVF